MRSPRGAVGRRRLFTPWEPGVNLAIGAVFGFAPACPARSSAVQVRGPTLFLRQINGRQGAFPTLSRMSDGLQEKVIEDA